MAYTPATVTVRADIYAHYGDTQTHIGELAIEVPLSLDFKNLEYNDADDEEFCDECLAGLESDTHLTSPCGDNEPQR